MTNHERNARAGFALGVYLFAACLFALTGCEEKPEEIVIPAEPQVVIPTDCPAASWDDGANECRETASGKFVLPECCGRTR